MTDIAGIPTPPIAEDLQINLDEVKEEVVLPENKEPEINFDLDLNLSDAPKNDNRLTVEDKKNAETIESSSSETSIDKPTFEELPVIDTQQIIVPIISEPVVLSEQIIEPSIAEVKPENNENISTETTIHEEVQKEENTQIATETITEEANVEKEIEQINEPATILEPEPITNTAQDELKEDMKMINELEWDTNAGGLAPEAIISPQQVAIETPKTFDLDAMLGNPTITPVIDTPKVTPVDVPPQILTTPISAQAPAFTIPTTTTQVPVQAVIHGTTPQKKNIGVKVFLFVMMFVWLWFTTFFILKTMYPIEFGNIFSGQTAMHASDITTWWQITGTDITTGTDIVATGDITTGNDITGTDITTGTAATDQTSGVVDTGTGSHESAPADNTFWALQDLGTTTTQPAPSDIGRLTDYVNQWNDFLTQGKTMHNNTIIKYGLYISKKSTTFLDDIANGKQIANLTGYFAQFDQYIVELKKLVGQTSTDANVSASTATVSTTSSTNDIQSVTPDSGTTIPPTSTWLTSG